MVVDAEKKESERKRKRKTLLSEKKESVLKKSLTGPTLLEMSGKATYQELTNNCPEQTSDRHRIHLQGDLGLYD